MYASTVTSNAFDQAFARYDAAQAQGEAYDEAFRAYAEANDYDLDDQVQYALASRRFDELVEAEREAHEPW